MKAQLMAQSLPRLLLWFFNGTMKQGSRDLPGILHLEAKTLLRMESVWDALHCTLCCTCKHRASTIKTESSAQVQIQRAWVWHFMTQALFATREIISFREEQTIHHCLAVSIWPAYLYQHVNKYKLKSNGRRDQKSHSPINLCNCKQAINFFVSWSINKVSCFCFMGIYWCLLSLTPLNCKVLLDIWLPRHFRNAWLNYTQLQTKAGDLVKEGILLCWCRFEACLQNALRELRGSECAI